MKKNEKKDLVKLANYTNLIVMIIYFSWAFISCCLEENSILDENTK